MYKTHRIGRVDNPHSRTEYILSHAIHTSETLKKCIAIAYFINSEVILRAEQCWP